MVAEGSKTLSHVFYSLGVMPKGTECRQCRRKAYMVAEVVNGLDGRKAVMWWTKDDRKVVWQ